MKYRIVKGDITTLKVDAIVNAANPSLLGGGGVDGAIHRAAGRELYNECKTLGGCKTGEAKITKGYNLPAKYVIHTVGPIYYEHSKQENIDLLRMCYINSMNIANNNNVKSIAFPAISTGVYGFPKELAADTSLHAVTAWFDANMFNKLSIEEVIFVCFSDEACEIYERLMDKYNLIRPEPEEDFIDIYIYSKEDIIKDFDIPMWRRREISNSDFLDRSDKKYIWGALTMAVKDCLGVELNSLNPRKLPTEKLVIDKYHVSLSHSGSMLMIAISNKNIGVDIQKVSEGRGGNLDAKYNDIWSPREREYLLEKDDGFIRFEYWTKKEALYKYLDPGIKFDEENKKKIDTFDYLDLFLTGDIEGKYYYYSVCSELIKKGIKINKHFKEDE